MLQLSLIKTPSHRADSYQANIRAVTKELLYQATHKSYKNIHLDVEVINLVYILILWLTFS